MKSLLLPALILTAHVRASEGNTVNLLLNPTFEFHAFENHRLGRAVSYESHNVACWNTDAWGDIRVVRESHVSAKIRPAVSTHNMVSIAPGKRFWQFFTLPEVLLAHGDCVSLFAYGYQEAPSTLHARIKLMKLDSKDGTWSPADVGMSDERTFPRHARGELVVAKSYEVASETAGRVELRIDAADILGRVTRDRQPHSEDINTIGIRIEFANTSDAKPAWVYSPCLSRGPEAHARLPQGREMVPYYRHLPRTIQKLWKGEAIHVVVMGASSDHGDANPPLYCYDEDPTSPTFKQPISDRAFEPEKIGRPDLDGYVGPWSCFWSYTGRLRLELMRKFNLPVGKICLNYIACGGSVNGEPHSALAEFCSLSVAPVLAGHKKDTTWQELYPELFSRPEGPRPDLVTFGIGANLCGKTDTHEDVAIFEGMIRWIQRHYPNTEFLFCPFQNFGRFSENVGDMQALALRYQIPIMDYDTINDALYRWSSQYFDLTGDAHPQGAGHYVRFKQFEKAFECWDPIQPGLAQLQLPERLHRNSYGWEGEMVSYAEDSARLRGNRFVFEDTVVNCWGNADGDTLTPHVDGQPFRECKPYPVRNTRNSLFHNDGACRLGDRHVLELGGAGAKLTAVDAKVCPNRRFIGVASPLWDLHGASVTPFVSDWGAPYGDRQVRVGPGDAVELWAVCTDLSVAYADTPDGGTLRVLVDGVERLVQPANVPFPDIDGNAQFMENRKGILGLAFGLHHLRIEAAAAPVAALGVFTYDSRPNRASERRLIGRAGPGEAVPFSQPFKTRPVVLCHGGLTARPQDITERGVVFSGQTAGTYEVIGE